LFAVREVDRRADGNIDGKIDSIRAPTDMKWPTALTDTNP
jgi:hypothetical protein